ncbi:MAG: N-acetylmuramoyl-L-alanine amidase [Schleiferiaceae bacterium]|jgi:N-acetylmuramoyl-L-alanine amidase|nr:N-acetylmuramoyl-L-alanine amidase [Schleiferiaceae bacterium]MDP4627656.1 N-acetylmuramoyl-L-alanine amidase [Schleiferiaceae bacterium]MDP4728104.1 N-acetylmuramoyl-L-alanine amidase [Schleiferiaceae bacterium]MDP4749787.1 N-acetylmuramoyl-L-alanine amidase [Schleiferiaceae bacterium]MDP4859726.1 N-acetylmuramoyl-L-alanine amidase [Schleiferiaceae bacterium]
MKGFVRMAAVTSLAFFLPLAGFRPPVAPDNLVDRVIIDAGHGGKDPGNLGTGRYSRKEKDVALIVARQVGQLIQQRLPGVEVVWTRSDDRFLELYERTAIANREKGDLFISIHCDAAENHAAYGASTYVMGKDHDDENQVALRENSVILMEDNFEDKYEGFDPRKPETYIALTLFQRAYQAQSIQFAQTVQDDFRTVIGRKDRGVRQQPLYVTSRTSMPSALIELGFTTNSAEEDFLMSTDGQHTMAEGIYRAFAQYKARREGVAVPTQSLLESQLPKPGSAPASGDVPALPYPLTVKPSSTVPVSDVPAPAASTKSAPAPPATLTPEESVPGRVEAEKPAVVFRVQLSTSGSAKSETDPVFAAVQPVQRVLEGKLYKYYSNGFNSEKEALQLLGVAKKNGFPDAFLVAFRGSLKISVADARAQTTP